MNAIARQQPGGERKLTNNLDHYLPAPPSTGACWVFRCCGQIGYDDGSFIRSHRQCMPMKYHHAGQLTLTRTCSTHARKGNPIAKFSCCDHVAIPAPGPNSRLEPLADIPCSPWGPMGEDPALRIELQAKDDALAQQRDDIKRLRAQVLALGGVPVVDAVGGEAWGGAKEILAPPHALHAPPHPLMAPPPHGLMMPPPHGPSLMAPPPYGMRPGMRMPPPHALLRPY